MIKVCTIILLCYCNLSYCQEITGIVMDSAHQKPIEFVNIGIVGKNIGTVSNTNGVFKILLDPQMDADTLLFSAIGYEPQLIKIADLRSKTSHKIYLKKKAYNISEVVIKPRNFTEKTLGVHEKNNKLIAGFKDNLLGYECGIRIDIKKSAILKQLKINISTCTYDSIFYRLNVYSAEDDMTFTNILKEPIYLKMSKDTLNNELTINLKPYNIVVNGDFLVSLEHVKDLGEGELYFYTGSQKLTFFRITSQGNWQASPVPISISVLADVEE
ncbi:carboxypeptidase-like regulatory domain-containing protein [Draconibacterium sediminis]|uniref:carboxypeptidase-like regulatory domain-containing protein n=1 Tax=Draconibacterium sediminis TaxID=1544798 RepID=UPI0026EB6F0F|nr:carboxypeptidase-like regulatory domain-containing protein [Draconibacterium sediminis]